MFLDHDPMQRLITFVTAIHPVGKITLQNLRVEDSSWRTGLYVRCSLPAIDEFLAVSGVRSQAGPSRHPAVQLPGTGGGGGWCYCCRRRR